MSMLRSCLILNYSIIRNANVIDLTLNWQFFSNVGRPWSFVNMMSPVLVERTSSNQCRWCCLLVRLGSERLLKWAWGVQWQKIWSTLSQSQNVPINKVSLLAFIVSLQTHLGIYILTGIPLIHRSCSFEKWQVRVSSYFGSILTCWPEATRTLDCSYNINSML